VSEDGSSVVAHWQYALVKSSHISQLSRVGASRRETGDEREFRDAIRSTKPPPNPHDPDSKGRLSTTAPPHYTVTSTFNTTAENYSPPTIILQTTANTTHNSAIMAVRAAFENSNE